MAVEQFTVSFDGRTLHGDHWQPASARGAALLLHGGGRSSSAGLAPVRQFMFERGVSSTAFDFIGHGRTGGELLGSSLAERLAQLYKVIEARRLEPRQLALIGFSMGGHVAAVASTASAASQQGFAALGLVIPAAYSAQAAELRFGPAFSAAIRLPRSWEDSNAFHAVSQFKGRLQIISGQYDAVVPAEIPQRYFNVAVHCAERHHHVVADSGHDLSAQFALQPEAEHRAHDLLTRLAAPVNHPSPHSSVQ
ncbi:MAG TPA: alpha/beta fold hydrolase [Burkholderiaceae bacterium]|jgi:hypothetical protein